QRDVAIAGHAALIAVVALHDAPLLIVHALGNSAATVHGDHESPAVLAALPDVLERVRAFTSTGTNATRLEVLLELGVRRGLAVLVPDERARLVLVRGKQAIRRLGNREFGSLLARRGEVRANDGSELLDGLGGRNFGSARRRWLDAFAFRIDGPRRRLFSRRFVRRPRVRRLGGGFLLRGTRRRALRVRRRVRISISRRRGPLGKPRERKPQVRLARALAAVLFSHDDA